MTPYLIKKNSMTPYINDFILILCFILASENFSFFFKNSFSDAPCQFFYLHYGFQFLLFILLFFSSKMLFIKLNLVIYSFLNYKC